MSAGLSDWPPPGGDVGLQLNCSTQDIQGRRQGVYSAILRENLNMKLFVTVAVLCVLLSAAHGLKCYHCANKHCGAIEEQTCPAKSDRCFTITNSRQKIVKGCSSLCAAPSCCETDLCNGATNAGPPAILLLVSTALVTLFL
ncbi:hypothetical protein DPEC_G00063780 [Dallia pectoralis]|uniref:Uncharacterized protein n=1 Tax=Dallia pectoralis TaxID=75939 RepID=A0ACC2H8T8_DALPE|nr:hypothetical protein DPEC_G00063780 [Dallia pectoralis]